MQNHENDSYFTELSDAESSEVNGAYSSCSRSSYDNEIYYRRPRQHYMYYPRRERNYRTMVVMRDRGSINALFLRPGSQNQA